MSDKGQTIEVLRYARDVVLTGDDKWWKPGDPAHPATGRHCLVTSISAAARSIVSGCDPNEVYGDVHPALVAVLPYRYCNVTGPTRFNDAFDTTYEDVISLLDKAIKALEEDV